MADLTFRVAQRNDYQELAKWIVRISHPPEQHCLHSWSGQSAEALCGQLLGYLDVSELHYIIAFQDDRMVGAMGSEYDEELGRAWLHGPHVTIENWEAIALELFTRLRAELPASIAQLDAYLNIKNVRGRRFYSQQGFKENESFSYDYWLSPADRVVFNDRGCGLLEKQHKTSFVKLYQAIFPSAYYSGERLLKMIDASHQVFVVVERDEVLGFAVVSVDENSSTGEIQFLGVREDSRGQGHGRRLLLSAADWLLESAKAPGVCLNVGQDKPTARNLYESVGFKLRFAGVGLRRMPST